MTGFDKLIKDEISDEIISVAGELAILLAVTCFTGCKAGQKDSAKDERFQPRFLQPLHQCKRGSRKCLSMFGFKDARKHNFRL